MPNIGPRWAQGQKLGELLGSDTSLPRDTHRLY